MTERKKPQLCSCGGINWHGDGHCWRCKSPLIVEVTKELKRATRKFLATKPIANQCCICAKVIPDNKHLCSYHERQKPQLAHRATLFVKHHISDGITEMDRAIEALHRQRKEPMTWEPDQEPRRSSSDKFAEVLVTDPFEQQRS